VKRRPSALLLAILVAAGLPAAASAQQPAPADRAVLAESGIVFPERLGNFVRAQVSSLEAGRIAAHYILPAGGPGSTTVDLFVVRVGEPLAEEFAMTERMIRTIYTDLVVIRDLPAPAAAPGAVGRLWQGNLDGAPVLTGLILSHRNGWRIKLRATGPAGQGADSWADVDGLIRAFDWALPHF